MLLHLQASKKVSIETTTDRNNRRDNRRRREPLITTLLRLYHIIVAQDGSNIKENLDVRYTYAICSKQYNIENCH